MSAVCAVLLGLSMNVASSLVPDDWAQDHSEWVWAAFGLLALASIVCAVLAVRHSRGSDAEPGGQIRVDRVDRSTRVEGAQGPVVIAGPGAHVSFQSLEAAPTPAPAAGQVVVGELPGAPPALVAREAVGRLAEVFEKGGGVAAVSALQGSRGAGKSQVAAQYARQAILDGVELVAWVSADDHERLLAGLAEVARRIGAADPDTDSEEAAQRLRDALAVRNTPAVLVIDNATDPRDVRRYLPATGATRVIITSTDRAFSGLGTAIEVGVFDREQSLAYLVERTARRDDAGAGELAEALGHLPLALAQAATVIKLRGLTYGEYLDRLRSSPLEDTLPPDRGDAYPHGVARAIVLAVEAIEDDDVSGMTERVLATTAVLSSERVGREVIARILGVDADREGLDDTLARLVENSLLVWAGGVDAVVMHRLVARAIRDRLQRAGGLRAELVAAADGLQPLVIPEGQEWRRRDAGDELVRHAIGLWENAVSATDGGGLPPEDLAAFANLADWAINYLVATADLSRAQELGASWVDARERLLGPDDPCTLTARNNLAFAYQTAGDLTRAIPLFEDSHAARERVLGPDHPHTITSRNDVASAYRAAGDLGLAIPLFEETLAACERLLGPEHPATLTSRNNLAEAYRSAGDLIRAIPLFETTLASCELLLGPDDPQTLTSRNNLAGAYGAAGGLTRAIPLFEDNLAASERILGPDHPHTLSTRHNLASAYRSVGELTRAISLFKDTLAARERLIGAEHPHTLTSRNSLACAYQDIGDLDRAIPLFEDNLAARERILGPDHPNTLTSRNNLAGAYKATADLTRAIPLHEDTLAASERILGPDHPDTLTSRNNLADAYRAAGYLDRAIPLFEDNLAARERILGPDHPATLTARSNLAGAYQGAGNMDRAIPLHENTLAATERILGADHPHSLNSRNNLASAYEAAGDLMRAIPLYEDNLTARERVLGPDHPDTLTSRNNLAGGYHAAGDPERAIPLFEETLAACERALAPNHHITALVRDNLDEARRIGEAGSA